MLRFYSYYKQATAGRCQEPRPGFWDPIGRYKWYGAPGPGSGAAESVGPGSAPSAPQGRVAQPGQDEQGGGHGRVRGRDEEGGPEGNGGCGAPGGAASGPLHGSARRPQIIDTVRPDETTQEMFRYFEPLYEVIRDMPRPPDAFFRRAGGEWCRAPARSPRPAAAAPGAVPPRSARPGTRAALRPELSLPRTRRRKAELWLPGAPHAALHGSGAVLLLLGTARAQRQAGRLHAVRIP